jgi:hypothetical protein
VGRVGYVETIHVFIVIISDVVHCPWYVNPLTHGAHINSINSLFECKGVDAYLRFYEWSLKEFKLLNWDKNQ